MHPGEILCEDVCQFRQQSPRTRGLRLRSSSRFSGAFAKNTLMAWISSNIGRGGMRGQAQYATIYIEKP